MSDGAGVLTTALEVAGLVLVALGVGLVVAGLAGGGRWALAGGAGAAAAGLVLVAESMAVVALVGRPRQSPGGGP